MAALLFDLDGTLIDSAPDLARACNALLAELDLPAQSVAQITSYVGNGAEVLTARLLEAAGQPVEGPALQEHSRRMVEIYAAHPAGETRVYPGAAAELARLAAQGHRMALCTNKPAGPARTIIDAKGWGRMFDVLIGGDTLDVRKPDPQVLVEATRRLGAQTAILVGDSEVDAATAEAADVPFILFTEGYRKTPAAQIPHAAAFSHWSEFATALRRVYV